MEEQTVKDKKRQLEDALMGFPDYWDMVEEIAEATVDSVHYPPPPQLRELAPGEEHSRLEKEGYVGAYSEWSKGNKAVRDRFNKAVAQMEKYKKAREELTSFGKKKKEKKK